MWQVDPCMIDVPLSILKPTQWWTDSFMLWFVGMTTQLMDVSNIRFTQDRCGQVASKAVYTWAFQVKRANFVKGVDDLMSMDLYYYMVYDGLWMFMILYVFCIWLLTVFSCDGLPCLWWSRACQHQKKVWSSWPCLRWLAHRDGVWALTWWNWNDFEKLVYQRSAFKIHRRWSYYAILMESGVWSHAISSTQHWFPGARLRHFQCELRDLNHRATMCNVKQTNRHWLYSLARLNSDQQARDLCDSYLDYRQQLPKVLHFANLHPFSFSYCKSDHFMAWNNSETVNRINRWFFGEQQIWRVYLIQWMIQWFLQCMMLHIYIYSDIYIYSNIYSSIYCIILLYEETNNHGPAWHSLIQSWSPRIAPAASWTSWNPSCQAMKSGAVSTWCWELPYLWHNYDV